MHSDTIFDLVFDGPEILNKDNTIFIFIFFYICESSILFAYPLYFNKVFSDHLIFLLKMNLALQSKK